MSDLIANIRSGLAANLSTIPEVKALAYMKGAPPDRAVWVFPDEIEYDDSSDSDSLTFTVQATVGNIGDQAAQVRLDKMLDRTGAYSVKAAVESDRTLGGAVDDLRVTHCTGYQVIESRAVPNALTLSAQWTVEIEASYEA